MCLSSFVLINLRLDEIITGMMKKKINMEKEGKVSL